MEQYFYVDRVDLQMKYQFYVIDTATNVPYKRKQAGFENEGLYRPHMAD